ncbi:hypothetical protein PVAND_004718 [Polypedilum vanderplanki]|uniref:Scavenger receptor class B member 1-like protein n=1 Tax=Polypedilum vanderplanki TaxID=319348 RepID=A0A9J6BYK5_POLVA|nr:hypothetical protein PVAND_004718 [Polypedilum vanderplanki]
MAANKELIHEAAIQPLMSKFKFEIKKKNKSRNIFVLIFSSVFMVLSWFTDVNKIVLENIVLKNNSQMLDWYINPPVNKILKVYIFNYTNIEKYKSGEDKKLHVQDIGPFSFEEIADKIDVKWNDEFLTYRENRSHKFLPHLSTNIPLNSTIIFPNILLISAIPNIHRIGFAAKTAFGTLLNLSKPKQFENLTIEESIFRFPTPFKRAVSMVKWNLSPYDTGLLMKRSGISETAITINTGIKDYNEIGKIVRINGKNKLDIWKSESCNNVSASDGAFYGPENLRQRKEVQAYIPEICRTLPMEYYGKSSAFQSIPVLHYNIPDDIFNKEKNCEPKNTESQNIDGLFDFSQCDIVDESPPIFVSFPHFLHGDPKLFEHFEGLKPNKSHKSFVHLHPRISVPIQGSLFMQLNLQLFHFRNYFKEFPEGIILPLSWIEVTIENKIERNVWWFFFLSADFADYSMNFMRILLTIVFLFASKSLYDSLKKEEENYQNKKIIRIS